MRADGPAPRVTIACGGTGGHLFPGMAVGEVLQRRGCDVLLVVSPREIDQQVIQGHTNLATLTIPAVALQGGQWRAFWRGFRKGWRTVQQAFGGRPPAAVLAMGGFTSAPTVLAARRLGAAVFLHEGNSIPGRANRWLALVADQAFVYFPEAARRLRMQRVVITGMPVRPQFRPMEAATCRGALGLDPARPVVLVTGGSQGASGLNNLAVAFLPRFSGTDVQFIHLTGNKDYERVRQAYREGNFRSFVRPFLTEMELALGAATVALARAGASGLAELAAMRVPAVLVPFPAAADNHQFHNALAFVESSAARMVEQHQATPETLAEMIMALLRRQEARQALRSGLTRWDFRDATDRIAELLLRAVPGGLKTGNEPASSCTTPPAGWRVPTAEARADAQ